MSYYDYGANVNPGLNQWPNMAMQPVPQMVQPIQASEDKLVWVRGGEKAVMSYPQAPGRTGYYTDFDEPILVKKVTNNNGQISEIKIFDLVERVTPVEETAMMPSNNFVTADAFNKFQSDMTNALDNIMKKLDEQKPHNKPYNKGRVNNA